MTGLTLSSLIHPFITIIFISLEQKVMNFVEQREKRHREEFDRQYIASLEAEYSSKKFTIQRNANSVQRHLQSLHVSPKAKKSIQVKRESPPAASSKTSIPPSFGTNSRETAVGVKNEDGELKPKKGVLTLFGKFS